MTTPTPSTGGRRAAIGGALRRYGLVSISSALVSVAHLVAQACAIARLPANDIGMLAFAITLIQFGFGLSNALVCAPHSIAAAREGRVGRTVAVLTMVGTWLAIGYGALSGTIVAAGTSPSAGIGFGVATTLLLLRWFARNDAYIRDQPMQAAWSDLAYAVVLSGWSLATLLTGGDFVQISIGFVLASAAGMLCFAPMLGDLVRPFAPVRDYLPIWRGQASWALMGVATTEATSNAHSYLVTAMLGPAAFAPLGVAVLFLRPLNVCITALTQTERPRMARELAEGGAPAAYRSLRHFRMVLFVIWGATIVLAGGILAFASHLVVPATLDAREVQVAVALSAVIALIQCALVPPSVLLQAADRFRSLAMTSVLACGVSVASVVILLWFLPAAWTLAGIALGQLAMFAGIRAAERAWRGSTGQMRTGMDEHA